MILNHVIGLETFLLSWKFFQSYDIFTKDPPKQIVIAENRSRNQILEIFLFSAKSETVQKFLSSN